MLEEAFELFDAHPDAARALYAQFARGVTSDGFSWDALARTHHEVLAQRLARDPARAHAWSATAASLLASLTEDLHARLLHARGAETEKARLDARLDEQARALDEAAQALGDALDQSTGLRRQLEERASLLSSVLDAMASAVIAVSVEGKLILANSAARALGGVTAQGRLPDAATWTDTYHPRRPNGEPLAAEALPIARALRGESIQREEMLMDHVESGETHFVEISARPLADSAGRMFGAVVVFTDLTQRHRTEQRLAESEARYRVLFEASPHQMWSAGSAGILDYGNPQMLAYFGDDRFLSGARIAGVHPDDVQRAYTAWKAALSQGTSCEVEVRLRRADGVFRWHLIRARPLKDDEGRVVRWFGVNFDVEDLKRAQEAAEQETRMKSAFLSSMSHEIRTPMNAVLGFSSLLESTTLDVRQQEFLASIRASGEHLLGVINNILDFSKMEAGLLELDPHPFALRPLAEAALDIVSPNAADQGVELGCLIREPVPAGLVADEGRLRQVLVNLLGNAVKFTARGEVVLSVDARRTDDAGTWEFHFAVRDTGIGIPADVLPRLFREFSQAESSTQRRFGGTGLGLAISRRIVDLHGGRIWAESEENRGSTFHVVLRAREAPGIARDAEPADLTGRRLLAVDDNAANLEILTLQGRAWGMQVRAFGDPREALECVRDGERFDLAVLDHRMPFLDGVSLAQALRQLPGGDALPLVMLSSLGAQVRSTLFASVLTKPVHQSALRQALRSALRLDGPADARAPAATETADLSGLSVLLAEDNLLNQRVARLLLDRLGLTADPALNGREAVQAVTRKRYDVVLMDVEMPEMDGLEAAAEIVRRWGDDRPWLVAVTAQALQGDRERCLAAGFDDYLSKPLAPDALGAALARVPRAGAAPQAEDCDDFNAAKLETMRASYGDAAVGEIVEALGIDLPQQTADFVKSRNNGDFKTFGRVAHTFKSSSRMFGAEPLALAWQEIESSSREGRIDQAAADAAFARYRALVAFLERKAKVS